jgi:hypothetical protein
MFSFLGKIIVAKAHGKFLVNFVKNVEQKVINISGKTSDSWKHIQNIRQGLEKVIKCVNDEIVLPFVLSINFSTF